MYKLINRLITHYDRKAPGDDPRAELLLEIEKYLLFDFNKF